MRVVAPSERVRRKAEALFAGRAAEATDILSQLVWGQQSSERIHTAVLVVSDGEWTRFLEAAWLARMDWRDVLVGADLADEGWPDRVDAYLRRP